MKSVNHRRCHCGDVFPLPSLMSTMRECAACLRKKAVLVMEARKHETARVVGPDDYTATAYVKGGRGDPALSDRCAVGVAKSVEAATQQRPLDATCEWRMLGGTSEGHPNGLTWESGAEVAVMPSGHALVAFGAQRWAMYDRTNIVASESSADRDASKRAALAKWREMQKPEASGRVDPAVAPLPPVPRTRGEADAILKAGWWLALGRGCVCYQYRAPNQCRPNIAGVRTIEPQWGEWRTLGGELSESSLDNGDFKPIRPESA